jgi:hypothetical protein
MNAILKGDIDPQQDNVKRAFYDETEELKTVSSRTIINSGSTKIDNMQALGSVLTPGVATPKEAQASNTAKAAVAAEMSIKEEMKTTKANETNNDATKTEAKYTKDDENKPKTPAARVNLDYSRFDKIEEEEADKEYEKADAKPQIPATQQQDLEESSSSTKYGCDTIPSESNKTPKADAASSESTKKKKPSQPRPATLTTEHRIKSISNAQKLQGNEAFKKGDYITALTFYTQSIETCLHPTRAMLDSQTPTKPTLKLKMLDGDEKELADPFAFLDKLVLPDPDPVDPETVLYVNRAAARLKLADWNGAEEDCTKAIEMDSKSGEDMNLKAFWRRAAARRALKNYAGAIQDIQIVIHHSQKKATAAATTTTTTSKNIKTTTSSNNVTTAAGVTLIEAQRLLEQIQKEKQDQDEERAYTSTLQNDETSSTLIKTLEALLMTYASEMNKANKTDQDLEAIKKMSKTLKSLASPWAFEEGPELFRVSGGFQVLLGNNDRAGRKKEKVEEAADGLLSVETVGYILPILAASVASASGSEDSSSSNSSKQTKNIRLVSKEIHRIVDVSMRSMNHTRSSTGATAQIETESIFEDLVQLMASCSSDADFLDMICKPLPPTSPSRLQTHFAHIKSVWVPFTEQALCYIAQRGVRSTDKNGAKTVGNLLKIFSSMMVHLPSGFVALQNVWGISLNSLVGCLVTSLGAADVFVDTFGSNEDEEMGSVRKNEKVVTRLSDLGIECLSKVLSSSNSNKKAAVGHHFKDLVWSLVNALQVLAADTRKPSNIATVIDAHQLSCFNTLAALHNVLLMSDPVLMSSLVSSTATSSSGSSSSTETADPLISSLVPFLVEPKPCPAGEISLSQKISNIAFSCVTRAVTQSPDSFVIPTEKSWSKLHVTRRLQYAKEVLPQLQSKLQNSKQAADANQSTEQDLRPHDLENVKRIMTSAACAAQVLAIWLSYHGVVNNHKPATHWNMKERGFEILCAVLKTVWENFAILELDKKQNQQQQQQQHQSKGSLEADIRGSVERLLTNVGLAVGECSRSGMFTSIDLKCLLYQKCCFLTF